MTVPLSSSEETPDDLVAKQRVIQWTDQLFRTSPLLQFMNKHLALVNCPLTPSSSSSSSTTTTTSPKIIIGTCPDNVSGGFSPDCFSNSSNPSSSQILICANRIYSKSHLEATLTHEMIHFFDHCRFVVNWTDLRHHACSEIRAANLSGDCSMTKEWNRRFFKFKTHHQECIRRRAVLSVVNNPSCPDSQTAEKVVNEVFDSCFQDTRPFDEIY